MKKPILFFVGAIIILILISLALTINQVGLPGLKQPTQIGFGGTVSSLKMATADRVMVESASVPDIESTNIPRQVTKTGSISILVETAETATKNIKLIAESVEGYISDSYLYEVTPGIKAGAITLRVPADKFDETITQIKNLALKVETENVSTNDVTEQFIDLEARLKNLEAEETQYLNLLKKAEKIEDILSITSRLNQVRQKIDSLQGQLKYLNSQIDFSSITVNLTAEPEVQIFGLNWRPLTVIKQAFRSLLNSLVGYANMVISAVIFLPVVILWLVTILLIVWIIWWAIERFRKAIKTETKTKKKNKKTTV